MSVCLCVCVSVRLCVYVSVCLCVCVSVRLGVFVSECLCCFFLIRLLIYSYIYLSIYLHINEHIHVSIYLFVYIYIFFYIHRLTNLTRLSVSHNQLKTVPSRIGKLCRLCEFDAQANRLVAMPRRYVGYQNIHMLPCSRIHKTF